MRLRSKRQQRELSSPCVVYTRDRTIVVADGDKTVYPYSTGPLDFSTVQGSAPPRKGRSLLDERNRRR